MPDMRHFGFVSDADRERLFLRAPESFTLADDPVLLGTALGATLYCPATRPHLAADILRRAADGLVSVVVCLEDAVPDEQLTSAQANAVQQLRRLAGERELPMLFVRVRSAAQIPMIVGGLGDAADVLAGFVLPKFTEDVGGAYLDAVLRAGERLGRPLYVMPVLEAGGTIFAESRVESLTGIRRLLEKYRDIVPAVRVGATDLSSAYGLRRPRELTVWNVRVVADAIADFVNILGRADDGFVLTGPVWEYYSATERLFKPQLRETPFAEHDSRRLRAELLAADLDGLIREVTLDRANGLIGKTVIHPSHVAAVHAISVVAAEEYADACDVLASNAGGGAQASTYANKMNESKPHAAWARRTMLRARAFGVAREDVSFVDLLGASLHR
jgi:citrate lyase beta subunit